MAIPGKTGLVSIVDDDDLMRSVELLAKPFDNNASSRAFEPR
jgi:hypothetical protein